MAKKDKSFAGISPISMSRDDKDAEIKRMERERVAVNEEIEGLLREYAKLTGERTIRLKKHRTGDLPNDYNYKRK